MKDKYKIALLMILKNIVALICFTILSIIFKNLFIVFLSLLFWSFITIKGDD